MNQSSENGTADENRVSIEDTAIAHSVFVKSFEKWLVSVIDSRQDEAQTVQILQEKFKRAMKGNAEYHEIVANQSAQDGDKAGAKHHRTLAVFYDSLL